MAWVPAWVALSMPCSTILRLHRHSEPAGNTCRTLKHTELRGTLWSGSKTQAGKKSFKLAFGLEDGDHCKAERIKGLWSRRGHLLNWNKGLRVVTLESACCSWPDSAMSYLEKSYCHVDWGLIAGQQSLSSHAHRFQYLFSLWEKVSYFHLLIFEVSQGFSFTFSGRSTHASQALTMADGISTN